VEILVVTLGENGAALWHRSDGILRQTAFAVDPVDATGCGDAFLAGLVAASSGGEGWADALRVGAACGAITCGRIGVVDALPYPQQISDLISPHIS
jgi:ribokinase